MRMNAFTIFVVVILVASIILVVNMIKGKEQTVNTSLNEQASTRVMQVNCCRIPKFEFEYLMLVF